MKKFFTILFFALLLNACHNSVFAQSTWIKTQNLDNHLPALHQDSLSVGPLEISMRPDGKMWVLMQVNQDHETRLYLIDSSGSILFSKKTANYGGHYNEDCFSLHATNDSGCVYILRHHLFGYFLRDSVYRVGSDGSILWTKMFYEQYGFPAQLANSIVPTYYNTFLVSLSDGNLVEYLDNGVTYRTRFPYNPGIKIHTLIDSTIIYVDSSKIKRENYSGFSIWNLSAPGFSIAYSDLSITYAFATNTVMKINTSNGNVIWSKPITSQIFSKTSDDGFIILDYNLISKYDSSGTIQWTKTKLFPQFDFKAIYEIENKKYITGGCWKNLSFLATNYIGYSPFLATIDSSGNGVIDSTDYYFIGNANDNNWISFGDEAVYVAAAINNSGPARDSLLKYGCCRSVFGTEWSGEFCTGINYKYSDVDGNGIVDTNDVVRLGESNIWYQHLITPHWLRLSENSLAPPLIFSLENNFINILDTVRVHVILGSTTQPVDSIYGLSFDLGFSNITLNGLDAFYSIHPTSLGDTAINLYPYFIYNTYGPANSSLVLCRTDHVNVSVAGDTIANLNFVFPLNTNIGAQGVFIVRYSAINECGSPITLNIVSDTIYSAALGISKNEFKNVRVYPNPSSDKIIFELQLNDIDELSIFDATGRKILAINNPGNKYILNVRDFAEGVYYFSTHSSNKVYRSKFLVVH